MEIFRLHVESLGRIRTADLGIRPLTVFIGENHTNKTWTAYALYALAQRLCRHPSVVTNSARSPAANLVKLDPRLEQSVNEQAAAFERLVTQAGSADAVEHTVTRGEALRGVTFPVRFQLDGEGVAQVLAMPGKEFADTRVILEMSENEFSRAAWDRLALRLQDRDPAFFLSRLERAGEDAPDSRTVGGLKRDRLVREFVKPALACLLMGRLRNVVVLPAERKTLVLLEGLLDDQARGRLSMPSRAFLALLQSAGLETRWGVSARPVPEALGLLEERLLMGRIAYPKADAASEIGYAAKEGPVLPMRAASSLVRALAGLAVYVERIAEPDDLLVIDEPEMNLHPEAQLMVAELLALLVNRGVCVVITTHSPYIVDHLNNLMEAARLPEPKRASASAMFRLGSTDALIPGEKVAAYLFGLDGSVSDAFDRGNDLIRWSTFGHASDYVTNLVELKGSDTDSALHQLEDTLVALRKVVRRKARFVLVIVSNGGAPKDMKKQVKRFQEKHGVKLAISRNGDLRDHLLL